MDYHKQWLHTSCLALNTFTVTLSGCQCPPHPPSLSLLSISSFAILGVLPKPVGFWSTAPTKYLPQNDPSQKANLYWQLHVTLYAHLWTGCLGHYGLFDWLLWKLMKFWVFPYSLPISLGRNVADTRALFRLCSLSLITRLRSLLFGMSSWWGPLIELVWLAWTMKLLKFLSGILQTDTTRVILTAWSSMQFLAGYKQLTSLANSTTWTNHSEPAYLIYAASPWLYQASISSLSSAYSQDDQTKCRREVMYMLTGTELHECLLN